jgi:hypothetical protein
MKLNKTTKSAITVILVALLIELWRNFPWLKKVFLKAGEHKDIFTK